MANKLNEKDEVILKDIFLLYDRTGTEKISVADFSQVLRSTGLNPTQAEVVKILREFGKEAMTFDNFLPIYSSMTLRHSQTSNTVESVMECLKNFDMEHNGFVQVSVLRSALTTLGEKLSLEEFDVLTVGRVDDKGEINYETFVSDIMAHDTPF